VKDWKSMPLYMDWCGTEPAKHACENWHYSRIMPGAPMKIGVWEYGIFVGAVLYGYGAGQACNGKKYGLSKRGEIAELSRVALKSGRSTPTSKIVARSIRMVKESNPKLRMLISFADKKERGHNGTIYQATNWIFAGVSTGFGGVSVGGKKMHRRAYVSKYKGIPAKDRPGVPIASMKYRYLYPLDKAVAVTLEKFRQPYPNRARSDTSDTPGDQPGEGGAAPTLALSSKNPEGE